MVGTCYQCGNPTPVAELTTYGRCETCATEHLAVTKYTNIPSVEDTKERSVRVLTYNGVTMTISEWAKHLGMSRSSLDKRVKEWGVERALSQPRRSYRDD